MASSGSFTGGRVGTSPYLILDWSILEQDVANNRSKVRLTLKCYSQYNISFSATKSGTLYGTNFSYSGGMSGSNVTKTLYKKDVWISHNSDGTKSVSFNAVFNINVTWSGSSLSSLSVSGTASLNTIPRGSVLNSFTMNGSLSANTSSAISLSITRYSSSFTHDITLKIGSYTVKTWTGQGTPTSLSIAGTEVNTLLTKIPNSTTATMTLIVQTKSGSSNIGSSVSKTATVVIDSSVVPFASGLSVSIYGTGRDYNIDKYVQNISKAMANFNADAGYGASITSTYIIIRRNSDNANSQTISGTSGTTANVLSLSGTYEAVASVTDSRGRTHTQKVMFTVYAYSAPTITGFSANRDSLDETIVNVVSNGTFTPLSSGNNNLTVLIQRRLIGGSWTTLSSTTKATSPFTQNPNSNGNIITSSYEFKITITDLFGRSASATVTISTSKVVFDICKNNGVGIGKIWENGVLDIGGDTYFNGHNLYGVAEIRGRYDSDFYVLRDHNNGNITLDAKTYLWIGYTSSSSIRFQTSNTNRGTIDSSGNWSLYGSLSINGHNVWHDGLDSGWINLSLSGSTAYSSGTEPRYRKIRNIVFVQGEMKLTSTLISGDVRVIGTLPAGYRPARNHHYLCQGSGNNIWLMAVNYNGQIEVGRYRYGSLQSGDISTSTWLPFAVSFAV